MTAYRKPDLRKLRAECARFNAKCPVGGAVICDMDGGERRETVTVSEAQVLSGHTAVVWMAGISGCYLLSRVTPISPGAADTDGGVA